MKRYLFLVLKGIAMGIANVIPGVSGGTVALITGIYEELINSLKSFDKKALKYILSFKINKFINYTNLYFIIAVFGGSVGVLFIIADPLGFLLEEYPLYIWSLFFGLIAASIFSVGKRIKKWNISSITCITLGMIIAIIVMNISPNSEPNDNLFYIFLCGIISISGMMLPGLSGSYLLMILGNYKLILVTAVQGLFNDFKYFTILSVFCAGSLFGLLSFSHLLSWLLKKYRDQTLAILTGFIAGSLAIIWPWKNEIKSIKIDDKIITKEYENYIPKEINIDNLTALIMIISGILIVYLIERNSIEKK